MATDDLRLDLEELRDLRGRSARPRVQDLLDLQIRRLETDLAAAAAAAEGSSDSSTAKPAKPVDQDRIFTREIKIYAWDQSDKYFKLYVSDGLTGVGSLDKDSHVLTEFTETSVRLRVLGLGGRDHELRIPRLFDRIVPGDSSARVKRDQVVLMLRKAACSTWSHVTEQERRSVEQKTAQKKRLNPAADEEDPNAGLMGLMRQMYEDGDDEMKRTIAKAWSESQSKRAAGDS